MSGDDRFEDLSPGERLAERDRTHPEPVRPPEVPRPGNKYAWLVGILMLMGLAVLLFAQTLPNKGKGLRGPEPGHTLPAFAAPDGPRQRRRATRTSARRRPATRTRGRFPPARCAARGSSSSARGSSGARVMTFVVTRGTDCEPQVDRLERIAADFPGVEFVTVLSGDSKDEATQPREGAALEAARGGGRGRLARQPVRRGRVPDHRVRP